MPYAIYKIIHVLGILFLFLALGSCAYAESKKKTGVLHGVGVFFILLGGFGLLARLEVNWPWPLWTWLKVLTWVLFVFSLTLTKRIPFLKKWGWILWIFLGGFAAYLANYKITY